MLFPFPGGLAIRFGHLGQITGAVRAGLIAETGIDPDTYVPSSVVGAPDYCPPTVQRCEVDVLGDHSFTISAHDEIARAQTDAAPIPGHPGYFRAQIGPSIPPWSQVEFFMSEALGNRGADVCVYQYLARRQADRLRGADDGGHAQSAIAALCRERLRAAVEVSAPRPNSATMTGYLLRDENDFSSIHAQLGGWYERAGPGVTADEQFSIGAHPSGRGRLQRLAL